jgi:hypothetical protein
MATPRFRFGLAMLIGIGHLSAFFVAFAVGFGMGDGGGTVPQPLQILTGVLGAPLMLIFTDASKFNFIRRFVDDSAILMTIALFNSMIWGFAIASVIWLAQRRLSNFRWSGP